MVESGSATALSGWWQDCCCAGWSACVPYLEAESVLKKVQHSLDEEERAFQEYAPPQHARCHPPNVARAPHAHGRRVRLGRDIGTGYNDEQHLDGGTTRSCRCSRRTCRCRRRAGEDAATEDAELAMPTRAEDVDKFMAELAAAAAGGLPPVDEGTEGRQDP